jgi:uncharacterized protein DUF1206
VATEAGPAEGGSLAHRAAHSTALRTVARVGLVGYALLHLLVEVLRHHRLPALGSDRRRAVVQLGGTRGTALVHGFLAVSATRVALGSADRPGEDTRAVRGVLAWPGGQAPVVVVGLVVVAIGAHQVRKGLQSDFLDGIDLATVPGAAHPHPRASRAGSVLEGVAFVLVGEVVAWAAATFDPAQAIGLDGALRAVTPIRTAPGCWSWWRSGWPPSRCTAAPRGVE